MEFLKVKDENEEMEGSSSSFASPRPMEGLHDSAPPPFLTKTFDMVEDPATDSIVSWSQSRNSFIVWDVQQLATDLLPKYFKHGNFSSFIRQLNTYGFRKVDPDRWEFANERFLGGQKHMLKRIKRRNASHNTQQHQEIAKFMELGRFNIEGEVSKLRRDRNLMMLEIVKLRQQQKSSRAQLAAMEERLQVAERKQRHTLAFLVRALKNPTFVQQLIQHCNQRSELGDGGRKRRLLAKANPVSLKEKMISGTACSNSLDQELKMETEMGLLFSGSNNGSRRSNGHQNAETIASTGNLDMDIVDDITWKELMNDDILFGEEDGGDQVETVVEANDLSDRPYDWGNEAQMLEQMGFLES